MALLILILGLASSTQPSADLWATHCLHNVFRDTAAPSARDPVRWSGGRNQFVDAQIVVHSDAPLLVSGVSCSVLRQAGGATIEPAAFDWHFVEYQLGKNNSSK